MKKILVVLVMLLAGTILWNVAKGFQMTGTIADIEKLANDCPEFRTLTVHKSKPDTLLIRGQLRSEADLHKLLLELDRVLAEHPLHGLLGPSIHCDPRIVVVTSDDSQ